MTRVVFIGLQLSILAIFLQGCTTRPSQYAIPEPYPPCTETLTEKCIHSHQGLNHLLAKESVPDSPASCLPKKDKKENNCSFSAYQKGLFAHEFIDDKPPALGLALAGGGTKASSYAMGVLAGLQEAGILQEVDVISSVSGGSYAALFYMRSLIEQYAQKPEGFHEETSDAFFKDCIPAYYKEKFSRYSLIENVNFCEEWVTSSSDFAHASMKPFQDQIKVRYQQDILDDGYNFGSKLPNDEAPDDGTNKCGAVCNAARGTEALADNVLYVGRLLFITAPSLIPYYISDFFFDWNSQISPTQRAYQRGIYHTYGRPRAGCEKMDLYKEEIPFDDACVHGPNLSEIAKAARTKDDPPYTPNAIDKIDRHSFDALAHIFRDVNKSCLSDATCRKFPLWVVNATSGRSDQPLYLLSTGDRDPVKDSFEMTPFGYGSGHYNYLRTVRPPLNLIEATAASAAFMDDQQRNYPGWKKISLGLLMYSFNNNWGLDISNFNVGDDKRRYHKFLPLPFYLDHGFQRDAESVDIHLSDGGQSENLGVYPLIRRGVKNIIIADEAYDAKGKFEDICDLKKSLEGEYLSLQFPDLKDLEAVCNKTMTYDIHKWKNHVVQGCAYKFIKGETPVPSCEELAQENRLISNLFLLKPAYDEERMSAHIAKAFRRDGQKSTLQENVPYELLAYLKNQYHITEEGSNEEGKCPSFPQHTTFFMTLKSDPYKYGAYRELAKMHARSLKWGVKDSSQSQEKTLMIKDGTPRGEQEARAKKSCRCQRIISKGLF